MEIGRFGARARHGEHAVNLAAMVGLMVEEMEDAERVAGPAFFVAAKPVHLPSEIGLRQPVGPGDHLRVERPARLHVGSPVARLVRIGVGVRNGVVPRLAGETGEPNAVVPVDMVERLRDRAEEGAAVAPALRIRKRPGGRDERAVLPLIVSRQDAWMLGRNHVGSLHECPPSGGGVWDSRARRPGFPEIIHFTSAKSKRLSTARIPSQTK